MAGVRSADMAKCGLFSGWTCAQRGSRGAWSGGRVPGGSLEPGQEVDVCPERVHRSLARIQRPGRGCAQRPGGGWPPALAQACGHSGSPSWEYLTTGVFSSEDSECTSFWPHKRHLSSSYNPYNSHVSCHQLRMNRLCRNPPNLDLL